MKKCTADDKAIASSNEWIAGWMLKTKSLKRDERRTSVDLTTPLMGGCQGKRVPRLPGNGAETLGFTSPVFQIDDETLRNEQDALSLNTTRYTFIKKISVDMLDQREKWLVMDDSAKKLVVLHKASSCVSKGLFHGEFGRIPGSGEDVGMTAALFREVVLLRCCRKCPFVLNCHGFAVDQMSSLYISTEYYKNESLERIRERSTDELFKVVKHTSRQLLKALTFLHSNKIVHNDVNFSNVLIRHNDVTQPLARGIGEFHLKLCNFQYARDSGAVIKHKDEYFCNNCHSMTHKCHPGYDILLFGYLLFASIQGYKPWVTSCQCDVSYMKFCRKLESIKRMPKTSSGISLDKESPTSRRGNFSSLATSWKRKSLRTSIKSRCKIKDDSAGRESSTPRSWKNLHSTMSFCLTAILSPDEDNRPSASDLLCNPPLRGLFLCPETSQWQKSRLMNKITVGCISPHSLTTD